jgi:hypothetical protein
MRSRPTRLAALLHLILLVVAAPCFASDGLLGIFFDREARSCSGDVPTASFATLYVVFLPAGSTLSGIVGGEFRIDNSDATGFLFQSVNYDPAIIAHVGDAFSGGVTLAAPSCMSGNVVFLSFQVFNTGSGARDAVVRIVPKDQPTNPQFACSLATLCNEPTYTMICVDPGIARLNPSSPIPCSGRVDSEWTRVKELFR